MATDSPNICPHLEPAEGGAPSATSAVAPPSELPHPPKCRQCLCHTPRPGLPRASGDQRTRVSSSLGCGSPASTLPRVPGVQVHSSYLDIADPVFQSPCESQGSEVSAEQGAGPPHLCGSWEARVLPPSSRRTQESEPQLASSSQDPEILPPLVRVPLLSDLGAQAPSPFLRTQKARTPASLSLTQECRPLTRAQPGARSQGRCPSFLLIRGPHPSGPQPPPSPYEVSAVAAEGRLLEETSGELVALDLMDHLLPQSPLSAKQGPGSAL